MGSSKDICKCCNVIRGKNQKIKLRNVALEIVATKLNRMGPFETITTGSLVCETCRRLSNNFRLIPADNNSIINQFNNSLFNIYFIIETLN